MIRLSFQWEIEWGVFQAREKGYECKWIQRLLKGFFSDLLGQKRSEKTFEIY